jgi:hypothetical protein
VFDDGQARLMDFDGGVSDRHFDWGRHCFGLGVLLEDLKCEGKQLDELIRHAKMTAMTLDEFYQMLVTASKGFN